MARSAPAFEPPYPSPGGRRPRSTDLAATGTPASDIHEVRGHVARVRMNAGSSSVRRQSSALGGGSTRRPMARRRRPVRPAPVADASPPVRPGSTLRPRHGDPVTARTGRRPVNYSTRTESGRVKRSSGGSISDDERGGTRKAHGEHRPERPVGHATLSPGPAAGSPAPPRSPQHRGTEDRDGHERRPGLEQARGPAAATRASRRFAAGRTAGDARACWSSPRRPGCNRREIERRRSGQRATTRPNSW